MVSPWPGPSPPSILAWPSPPHRGCQNSPAPWARPGQPPHPPPGLPVSLLRSSLFTLCLLLIHLGSELHEAGALLSVPSCAGGLSAVLTWVALREWAQPARWRPCHSPLSFSFLCSGALRVSRLCSPPGSPADWLLDLLPPQSESAVLLAAPELRASYPGRSAPAQLGSLVLHDQGSGCPVWLRWLGKEKRRGRADIRLGPSCNSSLVP